MEAPIDKPRSCEASGWPGFAAVEAMASVNNRVTAAVVDFNGMVCSRIAAANQEWASFIGKRLAEDFELSRRFSVCRSPGEVLEAYSAFLQTAFEQYQAEFAHMLKLGQTFASQNDILLKQQIEIAALREEASRERGPAPVTKSNRRSRTSKDGGEPLNSAA